MRRLLVLAAICLLLCGSRSALAHRIDEYLQATLVTLEANGMQASMRLIPGVLVAPSVIAAIDSNGDGVFSEGEQQAYAQRVLRGLSITIDGKTVPPELRSWHFPDPAQIRDGMGEIVLEYTAPLSSDGTQHALILANSQLGPASVYLMNAVVPQVRGLQIVSQQRNESQSVYELDYQQAGTSRATGGVRGWLSGLQFASLFRLGMRHIAEGTDHLLFLLVLLLPAPLLVVAGRWARPAGVRQSLLRILGIVTAFTLGHSITLVLAAMNVVRVSERPIEVLIAASILVSAVHAIRPLFPGREAWVAAFFGLIHGLAFAATLDRLGLSHWQRLAGILAFNLGIETTQMLVVAAILPSLLIMSRTRAYSVVRLAGAVFAALASVGWVAERLLNMQTPVDAVVNILTTHAVWVAAVLFLVSLGSWYLRSGRGSAPAPGGLRS